MNYFVNNLKDLIEFNRIHYDIVVLKCNEKNGLRLNRETFYCLYMNLKMNLKLFSCK